MWRNDGQLSAVTQAELVRGALAAGRPARVAMRGTSMLPLLHEPMVLELRSHALGVPVGAIAVFPAGDRIVAHRIIALHGDRVVCCGDAQPHRPETVERACILGTVARVWSTPDAGAERIDGPLFRLRGAVYARTRALRAWLRAFPPARPRTFAALYAALAAILRGDASLAALLETVDAVDLAEVARRHACEALLHDALAGIPGSAAGALRSLLQRARWAARARTAKLFEQLVSVVRCLNDRGIEPVLLKGAARLWSDRPQSELHDSIDLDLLLSRDELDAARDALLEAGYSDERYRARFPYYRAIHHHLAPLHPPSGVSVELHRALASKGSVSLPTDAAALNRHTVRAAGPGKAYVLDRVGSALHLAVHGFVRPKLRDLFLLAQLLAEMPASERVLLRSIVESERYEPVRLQAVIYAAARMAGVEWPAATPVSRFADWMVQREDLPRPLRVRPECVDAWLAATLRPARAAIDAAFRSPFDRSPRRYVRALARLAGGITIAWYRGHLQQSQAVELLEDAARIRDDHGTIDPGTGSERIGDSAGIVRTVAQAQYRRSS